MKNCRICRELKNLSEFYAHPDYRDKRMSACKVCERQRAMKRYHEHRDEILAFYKTPAFRLQRKLRGVVQEA